MAIYKSHFHFPMPKIQKMYAIRKMCENSNLLDIGQVRICFGSICGYFNYHLFRLKSNLNVTAIYSSSKEIRHNNFSLPKENSILIQDKTFTEMITEISFD